MSPPVKKKSASQKNFGRYWKKRIRSRQFKDELNKLYVQEIKSFINMRVGDLIDAQSFQKLFSKNLRNPFNQKELTRFIFVGLTTMSEFLKKKKLAVAQLLDRKTVAHIESLFGGQFVISEYMEKVINQVMKDEFVGQLFIDVIHLSIVSFYKKVNPLFGGIAMAVLEKQIKGFIALFIPSVQKRATAFIVDKDNQEFLMEFFHSLFHLAIHERFHIDESLLSSKHQKKVEEVIKKSKLSPHGINILQEAVFVLYENLFRVVKNKRLKELIFLGDQAIRDMARYCSEKSVQQLEKPQIQKFIIREMGMAFQEVMGHSRLA